MCPIQAPGKVKENGHALLIRQRSPHKGKDSKVPLNQQRRLHTCCNVMKSPSRTPTYFCHRFVQPQRLAVVEKNWLEVADEKHRYCKNLRTYYCEWKAQGRPYESFWAFLQNDSMELEHCPRSVLEADVVKYCNDSERQSYIMRFADGKLTHGGRAVSTGRDGWIFVISLDGKLFANRKCTEAPRFHHTSFLAGQPCSAAGRLFTDEDGRIVRVDHHSGHYRPDDNQLHHLLTFLVHHGIDLKTMKVDMQRVVKVARDQKKRAGVSKREAPHLQDGLSALFFLQHKLKYSNRLELLLREEWKQRKMYIRGQRKNRFTVRSFSPCAKKPVPLHSPSSTMALAEELGVLQEHRQENELDGDDLPAKISQPGTMVTLVDVEVATST